MATQRWVAILRLQDKREEPCRKKKSAVRVVTTAEREEIDLPEAIPRAVAALRAVTVLLRVVRAGTAVMVVRRVAKVATTVTVVRRVAMVLLLVARAGTTVTVVLRAAKVVTTVMETVSAATGPSRSARELDESAQLWPAAIAPDTMTLSFLTRSRPAICILRLAMS